VPLLIGERLGWAYAPASGEELERLEQSLEPGPRMVLALTEAWTHLFGGGTVALLFSAGHKLSEFAALSRRAGAAEYESFFDDLIDLMPAEGLPADYMERSDRVEELVDDDAVDARLESLDDRYHDLEEAVGSPRDFALRYVHDHPQEFFLSEPEAAADVDAFIARLVARVGSAPRADERDLATAEAELDRPLPPLLRRLYLEVGAGGWGLDGGLLGPREVTAGWLRARRELHGPLATDAWPSTVLPIADTSAGGWICVGTQLPRLEVVRYDADSSLIWSDGRPVLRHEAFTLRGWLERWLWAPA
jgi:SMI1/KNR4 family protein SUKH-1/uncharacterized protein DUF4375